MAATVVESLSLSRPIASAAAPRASSACHVSSFNPVRCVIPQFSGLKAAANPIRVSSSKAAHSRTFKRAGVVVCETSDTAVQLPEVGKATWQSLVLESDVPVLVDFWAPWCGPCRMIEPSIIKLAKTYEGKLKCYKLNTDENPDLATQYGIRSIPTMMIFKNGEKKETVIGAVPESTLVTSIEKFI